MSIAKDIPILIVGAGSIGERHIEVLQSLGFHNLHVYRQRMLPLRNVATDSVHCFTDFSEVNSIKPYAAVICTPTAHHLSDVKVCIERGIHVLVEKPLAGEIIDTESLVQTTSQQNVLIR